MSNLFFVFTPLQLFVAQQIIRQERLDNCIMLKGHVSGNEHFLNVYEMMKIDKLWQKDIFFDNIAEWNGGRVRTISGIKKAHDRYKTIKHILEENDVHTIYLGEILNQACRFTDILFHHQGYKIVFFEEGTSHYVNRPYVEDKSLSHKIKIGLLDVLYFLPFYGVRFAEWNSSPNCSYEKLPIDKRFSIIPFHHKPFDVRLYIEPMFSEKLRQYVMSNVKEEEGEHRVMLMTDPLRELLPKEYLHLYFDTIKECVDSICDNQFLYIKFHPREIQSSREKILSIAKEAGVKYRVLSDEVNICVEYYLQVFHFEKIFFFNAATYFYNGYAFPKTNFIKLMPILYEKCKDAGVKNLVYMKNMLKMIESQ